MVFLNFVAIFLEFSITSQVRRERKDNFYFFSFAAFSCLFWLEMKPQWYFFIVLNFLEFSITHRVGTMRNDNFYFLSFPAFSNLFWLQTKSQWYFLNFWIFWPFFGIFYHASGKNGTEGYFFFSLFRSLFLLILAWNDATMIFLNFVNFFAFFWNFLSRLRYECNGRIIFIFSLSQPFPAYFGLKWSHNGNFSFF